jgi:branched-chain amino acid transport system ATP-binding protein
VLAVSNLSVAYGEHVAAHAVSLQVGRGEFVTIVGHNGSGKSSVCKALFGLAPFSGTVSFKGEALVPGGAECRRRGLALALQGGRVFNDLTVREHAALVGNADAGAATLKQWRAVVETWFPELEPLERRSAARLSGGERQMLALALCFLRDPGFVVLDEPLASLSPTVGLRFLAQLGDWVRGSGVGGPGDRAALITGHEIDDLLDHSQRVVVLRSGEVVLDRPAAGETTRDVIVSAMRGAIPGVRDAQVQPDHV